MPYDLKYHAEQDYIEATLTDRLTMGVVRNYLAKLLPVLEKTDCRRVLTDARKAESQSTARDILQFPEMLAASPLTQRLKRAILIKPGASGFDLLEIISNLQGQNVQLFTEQDKALEWLLSDED